MRLSFQGLRTVRFKVIAAVLLVAHALVHPVVHAVPVSSPEQVQVRTGVPADQQSSAEVKPPCLGCLLQRRMDSAPLRVTLPTPGFYWEYVLVGLEGALIAAEKTAHWTRAPPSL